MNFDIVGDDDDAEFNEPVRSKRPSKPSKPSKPNRRGEVEYPDPPKSNGNSNLLLIGVVAFIAILVFGGFMLAKSPTVNSPNVTLSCPELLVPACPICPTCPQAPDCNPSFVFGSMNFTNGTLTNVTSITALPLNVTISVWGGLNQTGNKTEMVGIVNGKYQWSFNVTDFQNATNITVQVR